MMERIIMSNNRRLKLISDFRDVLKPMLVLLYNWEEKPIVLFMAGSFIQGAMNKGNILFSHSERVSIDTPQPDGSVVKTSVFKHLGFI
jgi:hypothetical protein